MLTPCRYPPAMTDVDQSYQYQYSLKIKMMYYKMKLNLNVSKYFDKTDKKIPNILMIKQLKISSMLLLTKVNNKIDGAS